MKENKYDDDVFFNKYKEMNRSVQGLEGAGEWSQLKQLLPNFEGKQKKKAKSTQSAISAVPWRSYSFQRHPLMQSSALWPFIM